MYHESLREDIVQYMSSNKQSYDHLVDGDIDVHLNDQAYSDGRTTSWATEAELRAASHIHKLDILVSNDRSFREWLQFTNDDMSALTPCPYYLKVITLVLVQLKGGHALSLAAIGKATLTGLT